MKLNFSVNTAKGQKIHYIAKGWYIWKLSRVHQNLDGVFFSKPKFPRDLFCKRHKRTFAVETPLPIDVDHRHIGDSFELQKDFLSHELLRNVYGLLIKINSLIGMLIKIIKGKQFHRMGYIYFYFLQTFLLRLEILLTSDFAIKCPSIVQMIQLSHMISSLCVPCVP